MGLDQADKDLIVTAFLGGCFIIIAVLQLRKRAYLRKHGIVAEATVIQIEETTSLDADNFRSYSYSPVMRFLTPGQVWITATYDVGSNPAAFEEGDVVQVRFDPSEPESFIIEVDNSRGMMWLFLMVGFGISTYGIVKYLQ